MLDKETATAIDLFIIIFMRPCTPNSKMQTRCSIFTLTQLMSSSDPRSLISHRNNIETSTYLIHVLDSENLTSGKFIPFQRLSLFNLENYLLTLCQLQVWLKCFAHGSLTKEGSVRDVTKKQLHGHSKLLNLQKERSGNIRNIPR